MLGEKALPEILDAIRAQLLNGLPIADHSDLKNVSQQMGMIRKLQGQIKILYRAVVNQNENFWPALLEPGTHLTARPESFTQGSLEQMQITLMYSYAAWVETPGAIDVIRDLMRRKI